MRINNTYANRRSAGQCVDCGKTVEDSRKGKAKCGDCARLDAVTLYPKRKAKHAERRAKGLCPRCGRNSLGGFVFCYECRTRKKEEYRAKKGGAK